MNTIQTLTRERDEARKAVQFLMSQVERLAHFYMSEESHLWLAKNDAMNCGRRVLGNTSNISLLKENTAP